MAQWVITIEDFLGGLCPSFWTTDYPSYGRKNMAGKAQAIDLTDPSGICQGMGKTLLTNGTSFAIPIRFLDKTVEAGELSKTYGIGGDKLFQITHNYSTGETTIVSNDTFPRTISGASGEDVCLYQNKLYYSYNTSSSGRLGVYDLGTNFNDTFQTNLEAGVCHRMIRGGNDFLYIANGNLVASYDGDNDIFTRDDLDLPNNHEIVDLIWLDNWLYILTNYPRGATRRDQKISSSIFVWDTNSPSWTEEWHFEEKLTAFYFLNGILYVFGEHSDRSFIGQLSGRRVEPLFYFPERAPRWYQISNHKGFVIWVGGSNIYAFGTSDNRVPTAFFPIMVASENHTINSVACPFGFPIFNENSGSNYKNQKSHQYETNAFWKSLLVNIMGNGRNGMIDEVRVDFEPLQSGNKLIVRLTNNKGEELWTGTIDYSTDGEITSKFFSMAIKTENFRIELDWSQNSPSVPLKVKSINILGHTLK